MAKSKSSKQWLKRHVNDPYVQQAVASGYPSRAAFKLLEIQEKDKILKQSMRVVDLGAAPGGWSMVAKQLVGRNGQVVALDILSMDSIAGVEFIQGDFTEQMVYDQLVELLDGQQVDVVLSDMAPNLSGNKTIDQPRSMYLIDLAVEFAEQVLAPGGTLLMKVFHGEGFDALIKQLREQYKTVKTRKPEASRASSREVYVLAVGRLDASE